MPSIITYSVDASTELAANNKHAKIFYQQLFQLHEVTLSLSKAKSLDTLYRVAVESALSRLDIDRLGILMIDKTRNWMVGTWSTDEEGNVRSEKDFAAPIIDDVHDVISEVSTRGKVCVWHDRELVELSEEEGSVSAPPLRSGIMTSRLVG